VECKKAQPKEVMYAQQMAKGKAALQRGVYGDLLSKEMTKKRSVIEFERFQVHMCTV
jgi:hypothetical protein